MTTAGQQSPLANLHAREVRAQVCLRWWLRCAVWGSLPQLAHTRRMLARAPSACRAAVLQCCWRVMSPGLHLGRVGLRHFGCSEYPLATA